jgi:hypothetical protein
MQISNGMNARPKARATGEESTLAEIMRKAGEYYLAVH